MRNLIIISLFLMPVLAMAIVEPKAGETICYSGVNTKKKIDPRIKSVTVKLSRYKTFFDSTYSSIAVTTQKKNTYTNRGVLTDESNSDKMEAQMDCDGGEFILTQDPDDKNKVQIQIEYLSLAGREECVGSMVVATSSKETMTLTRNKNCKHVEIK